MTRNPFSHMAFDSPIRTGSPGVDTVKLGTPSLRRAAWTNHSGDER